MQLLGLFSILLLISASYGQDNATLLASDPVANPFTTSVIIAFPSGCQYSSKTVTLFVNGSGQNQKYDFTVPQCRLKRDVVVINSSQSANVETINVGYQVLNLSPNTAYTANYLINGQQFSTLNFTTKNGLSNMTPIAFARSGGMVVITVILSIAMFLLLVGLIVVLVLGGKGKK